MARIVNRLTADLNFKVWEYTREHYASAKKTDKDFAAEISEILGVPVSESTIGLARKAFGIPPTKEVIRASGPKALEELQGIILGLQTQVSDLTRALDSLTDRFNSHSHGTGHLPKI